MSRSFYPRAFCLAAATALATTAAQAGGGAAGHVHHAVHQAGAVQSAADPAQPAAFDILAAHVHRTGHTVTFHMTTHGTAGADIPQAGGGLAGARVWSYVWPTSLDPSAVGFEAGAGILAMAATSHPDFDDTPLFDENRDGDTGNDGGVWHSHWVVLAPTPECGAGALAVKDIPEGATPPLPLTWPGVPVLLDSPGYTPVFDGPEITVNAVVAGGAEGAAFDGVTAALRVNGDLHAPLLCVTDVFDIASGDLSLPGRVD